MSSSQLHCIQNGNIRVEKLEALSAPDLEALCDATVDAIEDGIGFNWHAAPSHDVLEKYWRGVVVIPERTLFVGRLDGTIVASAQMVAPPATKQTQAFAVTLSNHFVAPWARGHGLAKALLEAVEAEAKAQNYLAINLSVRATQDAALKLYKESGYECWGVQTAFEQVAGRVVAGHHFSKVFAPHLLHQPQLVKE